jgi:hypothetical protein
MVVGAGFKPALHPQARCTMLFDQCVNGSELCQELMNLDPATTISVAAPGRV